jgi:hypothetical protein
LLRCLFLTTNAAGPVASLFALPGWHQLPTLSTPWATDALRPRVDGIWTRSVEVEA